MNQKITRSKEATLSKNNIPKSDKPKSDLPKPNRLAPDHPKTSPRLITSKLLGLDPSFDVIRTADHAEYLEVFIMKKPVPVVCPHCSSDYCIGHGTNL